ncbi:MAG: ABC transporter ATP-binding protein [Erysipelotrichaceae bacterium]|nr:ABC transporter ATP-binding protein [Erysipelotrichaceae bacterium]
MKKIIACTKKYLPFIILAPVALMIEVILEVNIPKVMADIIDIAIPSGSIDAVGQLGTKMIIMALCSLLAGIIGCFLSSTGAIGFGSELRKKVFNQIEDFSFENVDSFQQSSLLTRLTTDVDYIQQGLRMMTTMFIRAPFMMVAAAIVAYQINKDLFVVFIVAIPIILVSIVIFGKIGMPKFRYMLTKYDGLNDMAQEYLTNVRVVKSFVRQNYEEKKFSDVNHQLMTSSIDIEGLMCLLGPVMQLIIFGCVIAVYYLGGMDIVSGTMELGQLTAFISYISQILMGLLMMSMIFLNIIRLKGSVDRLKEVLNTESLIKDGPYKGSVEQGSVDFVNVSFRYKNASKDSLSNINLHVDAGQTIGVIGATGCGKTSLVNLIARLYDASTGVVKISNRDVKEYNLKVLRDQVAMVLQQNVLFSGTIEENLRWGNENATMDEIKQACKAACADEFIESFPDGYKSDLGQGGVNVSGGQKQRLCIARALLKKPKIIILDDSTSAVDTHTDSVIRTALKENLKGTTTFIIAQRIASVMDADKVIVMDEGRVVDFDSPENLLKNNEIYRDIYQTQMKGVE